MRGKVLAGLAGIALVAGGGYAWRAARWKAVESRLSVRDFVAGIAQVQPDLKLVVAHVEFLKTMSGESAKSVLGVDLGTTKAALTVPVRAHYAVDLAGAPPAFRFDRASRVLAVDFADPGVQAVEVLAQDERVLVEAGWGRLRERSGRALEDALRRGVYDAAKRDAGASAALTMVRIRARPVLARFIERYLERAGLLRVPGGVEAVAVRFAGDPALAPAPR